MLLIKYSLILFLVGAAVFFIGFTYNGFMINKKPYDQYKWYETLVITENL